MSFFRVMLQGKVSVFACVRFARLALIFCEAAGVFAGGEIMAFLRKANALGAAGIARVAGAMRNRAVLPRKPAFMREARARPFDRMRWLTSRG